MTPDFAELIGIIIGDGNLSNPGKHYRVGFTGGPVDDREYFFYIQALIKNVWNKDARIFIGGRGIRIVVNSKQAFTQLVEEFQLPVGEGKCAKVIIPQILAQDWNLAKYAIRGIADTDGSVFVADKPGSPQYPSIEITTCSLALATQLKQILSEQDFRVANIWEYRRAGVRPSYKMALNGYANLQRWMNEIGFSNPVKRRKAEAALARQKMVSLTAERKKPFYTVSKPIHS